MDADENPYESPSENDDQDSHSLTPSRRRFHTVVGMWVSFGLALSFGSLVCSMMPMPDREYLVTLHRLFCIAALALTLLTACYAVQLIRLRATSDIAGGLFGLSLCLVPLMWGIEGVIRFF